MGETAMYAVGTGTHTRDADADGDPAPPAKPAHAMPTISPARMATTAFLLVTFGIALTSLILVVQQRLGSAEPVEFVDPRSAINWVYTLEPGTVSNLENQVVTWPEACFLFEGKQSPVDIQTADAVATSGLDNPQMSLTKVPLLLMTTPHNFQVHETAPTDAPTGSDASKGSTIIRGSTYNFYQLHIHTPSEHTVDGQFFSMEAHFVHQLAGDESLVGTNKKLAVVAVFFNVGDQCNPTLATFWDGFDVAQVNKIPRPNLTPDLGLLITPEVMNAGYYQLEGSLVRAP